MPARRLDPAEKALWARVMASVRPLPGRPPAPVSALAAAPAPPPAEKALRRPASPALPGPAARAVQAAPKTIDGSLDGGWERRISRGQVQPDWSLDLHGHNLASAHATLDAGIERAVRRGDRVILLVTGRPPRPESERPHARGAIRAAVKDWLAASRHADRIAAVRGAHPRHGGAGALYVILRRPIQRA